MLVVKDRRSILHYSASSLGLLPLLLRLHPPEGANLDYGEDVGQALMPDLAPSSPEPPVDQPAASYLEKP